MALDQVLNSLGVELSYDSRAISRYKAGNVHKTFPSPKEAIDYLLSGKPFVCEQIGNVYVISPVPGKESLPPSFHKNFYISGILTDKENGERLPYVHIITRQGIVAGDENGFFSLKRNTPDPVDVRIQYLGYHTIDTLLLPGAHTLYLSSRPREVEGITVSPSANALMMQSGRTSGEIRLNHAVTRYMPGSGDNSVFNLLRMMPGIRASGEPSEELIVWGSSNGESQIVFDGFTLFGLKSFSDNISFINPYMVKDIRMYKGGADASMGSRTGAITQITGRDGINSPPSFKANLSNLTANLFGSVPITPRSTLSAGYRQTFYNLYDVEKLNPYGSDQGNGSGGKGKGNGQGQGNGSGSGNHSQENREIYLYPDYKFCDFNIKYAGSTSDRDEFALSFYTATDDFDFSLSGEKEEQEWDAVHKNRQSAGSASYNRVWNNSMTSGLLFSFSRLDTEEDLVTRIRGNQAVPEITNHTDNRIKEFNLRYNHTLSAGTRQHLEWGGEITHYRDDLNGTKQKLYKPSLYVTDKLSFDKLFINAGVRSDFISGNIYIQPRISGRYHLNEAWTATASWGMYKQYIARIPAEDENNYTVFAWQIQKENPLSSTQSAAGIAFSRNGFLAHLEGYYKKNKNLTRLANDIYRTNIDISGLDLFLKKEFRKVSTFGSYSLSHSSERTSETGHEIKLGSIVSLSHFTFSANYVYGSGFSYLYKGGQGMGQGQGNMENDSEDTYSRFDIAATYNLYLKACRFRTGLSVLNVFDTHNIKYTYKIPGLNDITQVYTRATPFTPMLFVEVLF